MKLLSAQQAAAAIFATAAVTAVVSPAMAQQGTASGEVRRIDTNAGKITLKHGKINELELTAMTLVYLIDSNLLKGIQPGDQVKFTAERRGGDYIVLEIQKK